MYDTLTLPKFQRVGYSCDQLPSLSLTLSITYPSKLGFLTNTMAQLHVPKDTPLAAALIREVQSKVVSLGWVNEGDNTFPEYVVLSLDGGKNSQEFTEELAEILENAANVAEFIAWLADEIDRLSHHNKAQPGKYVQRGDAPAAASMPTDSVTSNSAQTFTSQQSSQNAQSDQNGFIQLSTGADQQSNDEMQGVADMPSGLSNQSMFVPLPLVFTEKITNNMDRPSGPKSMRNTAHSGRGGRILGHVNKAMTRGPNAQLHRIKGTANTGRINTHSNTPKGPRGGSRYLSQGTLRKDLNAKPMTPTTVEDMDPQQRMLMTSLMEQNMQLMTSFMQMQQQQQSGGSGGPFNMNGGPAQFGQQQTTPSLFDRVNNNSGGNMKVPYTEADRESAWKSICKQNLFCTFVQCPYAHQSPAASPGTKVDLNDACPFGANCKNQKCTGKHPSPVSGSDYQGPPVCKYYPNCTNPFCKFAHVDDGYPCENGGDCDQPSCTRKHIRVACKYSPCTNPMCEYQHKAGQKSGLGMRDAMRGKATWVNPEWKAGKAALSANGAQDDNNTNTEEIKMDEDAAAVT